MNMGDPFVGNVPRKISKEELVQAIRVDIAGELEAITVYDAHAMATDDPRAKAVLSSIRDEERQHVGELLHLMEILDPVEAQLLGKGRQEVDQLMTQKGQGQDIMSAGQSGQQISGLSGQQMPHSYQAGQQAQAPYSSGYQPTAHSQGQPQGQIGPEGLGQYHDFNYQPRPGNFGHRGPNQR